MSDSDFSTIPEILDELRAGRMVILTDDEHRENEGDLVLPAEFVTPELITFMLKEAKGYLCLSLTEDDCDRIGLEPATARNTSVRSTAFTVSIDGAPKHGFTTGVSAKERADCIKLAVDPTTGPTDFVKPGHVNPLRSRDGGVLVRVGQTEGSVDLCRLAGLRPAAIIIEIMKDDGEMARVPDLIEFCKQHNMKMCSVKQVIEHRLSQHAIVERMDPIEGQQLRTPEGIFNLITFRSLVDPLPHLALTTGGIGRLGGDGSVVETTEPTLVRVHRRDLLGDIFDALGTAGSGSSGQQLRASMRAIQNAGSGAIVYLRPQGAGETTSHKLTRPFGFDDEDAVATSVGHAMVEYGTGSQILRALGLSKLRLMTNSTAEYPQLKAFGLEISSRESI